MPLPGRRRLLGLAALVATVVASTLWGTTPLDFPRPIEIPETWAAGFRAPRGIVVDAHDGVFVADRAAGNVTRLDPDHSRILVAAGLDRPVGLALDTRGRLLVSEERAGRVVRIEPGGARTPIVAAVSQPRWIATGADGTLLVAARRLTPEPDDEAAGSETILALAPGRRLRTLVGGLRLHGLVLHDGVLIAATPGRGEDGLVLRASLLPGGRADHLTRLGRGTDVDAAGAVASDRHGAVFVVARERGAGDASGRLVVKIGPDGRVDRFADLRGEPCDLRGLAFDDAGNLYATDARGGRVLRLRAPAPPVLAALPAFTDRRRPTVTGTAAARARIDLVAAGPAVSSTIADGGGAFALEAELRRDAATSIALFAIERGGAGLSSAPARATIHHDGRPPSVAWESPRPEEFVRGRVRVIVHADDRLSGLASLAIDVDGRPLAAPVAPAPPAPRLTARALWDSTAGADGRHTMRAVALDRAGNRAGASRPVIVDNTPPETHIVSGPSGETSAPRASFAFGGADVLTPASRLVFSWRLDGGAFTPFSPDRSVSLVLDAGPHRFEVRSRDLAGNEDPTPATRSFSVAPRADPF